MSTNEARARTLERALRAGIDRDRDTIGQLCTEDVRAWTPALATTSRSELLDELDRRDESFSDVEVDVTPLDVGGDYACAEWSVAMTHTGPLTLPDDTTIDPTGVRVVIHGVTVVEFRDDLICAVRQYWDEAEVLEQLVRR